MRVAETHSQRIDLTHIAQRLARLTHGPRFNRCYAIVSIVIGAVLPIGQASKSPQRCAG